MMVKLKLALLCFIPIAANANEIANTCWPYGGNNNNFSVMLTNGKFSSSKAGSTAVFNYSGVPANYYVSCWSEYAAGTKPQIYGYYQTRIDLPPSEVGDGFYKVNEDFDVKIQLFGEGYHVVPSTQSIKGETAGDGVVNRRYDRGITFARDGGSNITLRLRRDQLGGVVRVPPQVKLFRGYRLVTKGDYKIPTMVNDTPIMSMSTAGQYILTPVVCTINYGAAIEVNFGDIDNTKLSSDGSSYVKTIPLQYHCNTAVTQDIDINLIAAPAAFSAELIATTLPDDVGVVVRHNGQVVKPNQKFATRLLHGVGQDELQVAPVARDVTKAITGSFTASATLIMTVQ